MTKIRTLFIFEILGKPAEHIKESLNKMVDNLSNQKNMEIVRREVHEPKLVEAKDDDNEKKKELVKQELFSTFAEVEIVTDDIKLVMAIVLNMLPAHVEILEPTEFNFSNHDLSSLMSELTVKMHKYDEVTKILMLERNELLRRLNEHERMVGVEEEVEGKVDVEKVEEKIDVEGLEKSNEDNGGESVIKDEQKNDQNLE